MTNISNGNDSLEIARSENGDSTSSELERLENNASPCPSGTDSPTERGLAKTKKQEAFILKLIEEATSKCSQVLDLSNKGVRQFPSEILEMSQLQYLYLEGNELSTIPDELFDKLPNLKWLDLRRNYIIRLPSVYTGRHQNLRNLLLESNNLRTLPLELGLIKTLNGLNISNNPLEFPPHNIIEKGTTEILRFLREMIQAKSSGKLLNGKRSRESSMKLYSHSAGHHYQLPQLREEAIKQSMSAGTSSRVRTGLRRGPSMSEIKSQSARLASQQFPPEEGAEPQNGHANHDGPIDEEQLDDDSSSSDDDWDDDADLREYAQRRALERSMSLEAEKRAASGQIAPTNKTVELHRPISYSAMKQTRAEKVKKAGASGTVSQKYRNKARSLLAKWKPSKDKNGSVKPQSATSVLNWKVNQFPEPPPPEFANDRAREERQIAKVKEFNEKTDAILQRRKDEDMLKDWRTETKRLQQKKYFDSVRKGTKDFMDPVQGAPFDIDQDYMKVPSNEERIKQGVKSAHEKIRRPLSPASRQRIEEEKAQRILQLEKRIKSHTAQMHDRRRLPKGTPQEEMEAARRELEVAEALHRELMARRKELEYRFTAFVADVPTSFARKKTIKRST